MSNSAPSGSTAATRDERFDILADASRRAVLEIVRERSPAGIEKSALAFRLAAVISDTRIAAVSEDEHQRALVEFHHRLVPQLVAAGFLAETDDGSVVPAEQSPFDDPVSSGSFRGATMPIGRRSMRCAAHSPTNAGGRSCRY